MSALTKAFVDRVVPHGQPSFFPSAAQGVWDNGWIAGRSTDVAITDALQQNLNGRDVYVTLARFSVSAQVTNLGGTPVASPQRIFDNVSQMCAIGVDLDTLENEAIALKPRGNRNLYQTKAEAIREIIRFCQSLRIPPPNLWVDTGGGLQLFWCFGAVVSRTRWVDLAARLQAALRGAGVKADLKWTGDCTTSARLPGTVNYKYNPPLPVTILHDDPANVSYETLSEKLPAASVYRPQTPNEQSFEWEQAPAVPPVATHDPATARVIAKLDELEAERPKNYRPHFMEFIVERCEIMREELATGGAGSDYNEWTMALTITKFCQDGEEYAHKISREHKEYSEAATNLRLSRLGNRHGPTRCQTMANASARFAGLCATCRFNGAVSSPYTLGVMDEVPWPFKRYQEQDGIFKQKPPKKDGDEPTTIQVINVTPTLCNLINVSGRTVMITHWRGTGGRPTTVTELYAGEIADGRVFAERMAEYNLVPTPANQTNLREFMASWYQKLQNEKAAIEEGTAQLGWQIVGENTKAFSYGGKAYDEAGKVYPARARDSIIRNDYTPIGSIEPWRAAVNAVLTTGTDEMQPLLATAFAAPLLDLVGLSGVVFSVVSSFSGAGKSSTIKTANAVWGNPKTGVQALNDTEASTARKLGILNNLPVYWDEIHMRDDVPMLVNLLFQMGQGKEKSRLTKEINMRPVGSWSTIMTVASNSSVADFVSRSTPDTDAGVYRVFEQVVKRAPTASDNQVFYNLESNFGHAGTKYAAYLGHYQGDIRKALLHTENALRKTYSTPAAERFWVGTMAAIIVGAVSAKQLGLVNFDMGKLQGSLHESLMLMRTKVSRHRGQNVSTFATIVSDEANNVLVTDVFKNRGQTAKPMIVRAPQHKNVNIHVAGKANKLRITKACIHEWCKRHGRDAGQVSDTIEHIYRGVEVTTKLGAGTPFTNVGGRTRCWEIDLTHPDLAGLSEDFNLDV